MNHRTCRPSLPKGDHSLQDAYTQIKQEFDAHIGQLDELRKQLDEVQDRITFLQKRAEPLAAKFANTLNETQSLYNALTYLSEYGAGPRVKSEVKVPDLVRTVMRHAEPNDDGNPFTDDIPF